MAEPTATTSDEAKLTTILAEMQALADKYDLELIYRREVGGRTLAQVGVVFTPQNPPEPAAPAPES